MGEQFFRLCPNCKQFFYSAAEFKSHQCGQPEPDKELNHRVNLMELEGEEDVDNDAVEVPEFPNESPTSFEKQDGRRVLKAKYVAYLKEKGIDMSNERSFKKVESEYLKHGGKK